ncbi:hypothetical protein ATCC90586_009868 [Pythium insidiosum]|nr:hypothetical protein ATCC90586_009868 [Pythium insidiosum]
MERLELCARLARLLRPAPAEGAATQLRDALRDVDTLYAQQSQAPGLSPPATAAAVVTDVDDMLVAMLLRLLATAIPPSDVGATELAFRALAAVLPCCLARLPPARSVDILQACAAALPVPPSASTTAPSSLRQQPEELRVAVLRVLEMLLAADAGAGALHALLVPAPSSTERVHFVAYVVSCLLHIAETDRCRAATQLALRALTLLVDSCDRVVLRQFYPGISIGMWRCVTAPLQSSAVMVDAIQCLARAIERCMSDCATGAATSYDFSLASLRAAVALAEETEHHGTDGGKGNDNGSDSAAAWIAESATRTDELLSRLLTAKLSHATWRVQRAVVDLCSVVVLQCRHSLRDALLRCVDELLVLRGHAIDDVSAAAQATLAALQRLSLDEWLVLEPRVAERFGWHLSTLALQCRTEQESVSVHTMEILEGYLQCLGHQQAMLSVLDESLPSVVSTLARVVEFDSLDVALVRHETLVNPANSAERLTVPHFHKRLRFFHDDLSVRSAFRLLRALGAVVPMALLVDTVLTMLREGPKAPTAAAIVVILNEALRVHVDARDASPWRVHLVGRILDELLELPQWTTPADSRAASSVIALLIETIGICAQLSEDAFAQFLLYVLYPLVEKLGDADAQVERAALSTLRKIAFLTGHGASLDALFENNMDYLVDALCRRLERLDEAPQAPRVVEALLRHTRLPSAKPLVDEITRALLRCIDLNQDSDEMIVLLRSLHLLVKRFDSDSSASSSGSQDKAPVAHRNRQEKAVSLDAFLAELRAWTEPISSELGDDQAPVPDTHESKSVEEAVKSALPVEYEANDESANDESVNDDEDDTKNRLPFEPQVLEIMARCSYFVVDSDPVAACVVLQTMTRGFLYLKDRERVLLPLIHRTWPSLLDRLSLASHRPLLTASIEVLTLLAEIAGDFIGDRFVESVWPTLRRVLETVDARQTPRESTVTRAMLQLNVDGNSAPPSTNESESQSVGGRHTQEMRLVETALLCVSAVGRRSTVVAALVPEIVPLAIRFLHPSLPPRVVAAAHELVDVLAELNGDEVFVALAVVAQWQPPTSPPSSRFPAYGANAVPTRYSASTATKERPRPTSEVSGINTSEHQWRVCRDAAAQAIRRLHLVWS